MKQVTGGVCAAQGFSAAGIHCGIRKNQSKRDLALIFSAVPASAAAVKPATTGAAARQMTPMPTICTSAARKAVPEVRDFMGLSPGAFAS